MALIFITVQFPVQFTRSGDFPREYCRTIARLVYAKRGAATVARLVQFSTILLLPLTVACSVTRSVRPTAVFSVEECFVLQLAGYMYLRIWVIFSGSELPWPSAPL